MSIGTLINLVYDNITVLSNNYRCQPDWSGTDCDQCSRTSIGCCKYPYNESEVAIAYNIIKLQLLRVVTVSDLVNVAVMKAMLVTTVKCVSAAHSESD